MAIGAHASRTVIVHVGLLRRVTDLAGRNVVILGPTKSPWNALATRLEAVGCPVDWKGIADFEPSNFLGVPSLARRAQTSPTRPSTGLALGRVLPPSSRPPVPRVTVKLLDRGGRNHLLEVANRGTVTLRDVQWEIAGNPPNWMVLESTLPEYPISELKAEKYIRVPVAVMLGGPVYVDVTLRARTEGGEEFETTERLSVYG